MIQKLDTQPILDGLQIILDAVTRMRERIVAAHADLVSTGQKAEAPASRILTIADRMAAYAVPTPESIKRGDYAATRLVAARARVSAEVDQERQQAIVACAERLWADAQKGGREFVVGSKFATSGLLFPPRQSAGEAAP